MGVWPNATAAEARVREDENDDFEGEGEIPGGLGYLMSQGMPWSLQLMYEAERAEMLEREEREEFEERERAILAAHGIAHDHDGLTGIDEDAAVNEERGYEDLRRLTKAEFHRRFVGVSEEALVAELRALGLLARSMVCDNLKWTGA